MSKNFQIVDKETNKSYWISRSVAVTGLIAAEGKDGEVYFLLERRGPGCPDNIGKLCSICGYLDWDETLEEAIVRETYEETGYKFDVSSDLIEQWKIKSDPNENHQNVVVRFIILPQIENLQEGLKNGTINTRTEERGGEPDEVSEIGLYSYEEIKKLKSEDFAFGHKEMIEEFMDLSLGL